MSSFQNLPWGPAWDARDSLPLWARSVSGETRCSGIIPGRQRWVPWDPTASSCRVELSGHPRRLRGGGGIRRDPEAQGTREGEKMERRLRQTVLFPFMQHWILSSHPCKKCEHRSGTFVSEKRSPKSGMKNPLGGPWTLRMSWRKKGYAGLWLRYLDLGQSWNSKSQMPTALSSQPASGTVSTETSEEWCLSTFGVGLDLHAAPLNKGFVQGNWTNLLP